MKHIYHCDRFVGDANPQCSIFAVWTDLYGSLPKQFAFFETVSKDGSMKKLWRRRRQQLHESQLSRTLRVSGAGPVVATPQGKKLIFCSNDYLGLAVEAKISEAAIAEMSMGVGAGASRLVSGNEPWHETLERRFAAFVSKSDSVLFPSGYQANVGTISALAKEGDVIFSDELAHASIIDGCRLAKARVEIFSHNDAAHLKQLLLKYTGTAIGKLVITEGIFSMDGDMPPLVDIVTVAKKNHAAIYVDEAHSIGIVGPNGRGLAAFYGVEDDIDIIVGTFGKAVGVSGAAVACSKTVASLLKSSARSLMYTTAPPACLARAVCKSLAIIETAAERREQLLHNIALFKTLAKTAGISLIQSDTPIQPVVIGDAAETMQISNKLWERGIFVQGIRPPTVPPGTERLRITICALHTPAQLEQLVQELTLCLNSK